MKILVTGDSFCSDLGHIESDYAWTRQIENIIPGSSVTCIGKGASSVFSALHQARKQLLIDNNYDAVIVLVTNHERLYQSTGPLISNLFHAMNHQSLYKASKLNKPELFNKLEACRMYYESLYENDLGVFILESCLKEFQSLFAGKKLIFYPSFNTFNDSKFAVDLMKDCKFTLLDARNKENENFPKLKDEVWGAFAEHIVLGPSRIGKVNHMCPDNQLVLARLFADLIQHGKSDITLNDFISLPQEDFELYYRPLAKVEYIGKDY